MDLSLVDLPSVVVRTDRLVLRPYRPEDVDPVHRACQDPDIQRWRRSMPSPYTEADAIRFVTGTTVQARAEGEGLLAAMEADGEFVGRPACTSRPASSVRASATGRRPGRAGGATPPRRHAPSPSGVWRWGLPA